VVINLLGCGAAESVLQALPTPRVVAEVTSREILRNPLTPTSRADPMGPLLPAKLIERVALLPPAMATFMKLVGANPPDDLGDGEAAAIALAQQLGIAIALDDTKARRIVREQFLGLHLISSVDIFASPSV